MSTEHRPEEIAGVYRIAPRDDVAVALRDLAARERLHIDGHYWALCRCARRDSARA